MSGSGKVMPFGLGFFTRIVFAVSLNHLFGHRAVFDMK